MPGIVVAEWDFQLDGEATARQRRPKRSSHMEAVVTFMENAIPGVYPATHLQKTLNMARDTWRDVKRRLTEAGSPALQRLAEAGVSVKVEVTKGGYERVSLVKA